MLFNLDAARFEALLAGFSRGRVLVVGDLFADEYVSGEVARISREAPVLILQHQESKVIPGGAANAAANVASLTGRVAMAGLVGTDLMADTLCGELERRGVDTSLVFRDPTRPTTTKTRISACAQQSVTQQIVRVDRESRAPLSAELEARFLAAITDQLDNFDALLLSDYGNGVLTPRVIESLLASARSRGKIVAVDSQGDLRRFPGVQIVTPNQPEAERVVGFAITDAESLERAGQILLDGTGALGVLITRGGQGMSLFERDGRFEIPAFNRSEVFDVTGAGDTVVGTLTLALAAGAKPAEAMVIANLAASIVVRRFGTSVTDPAEIRAAWNATLARQRSASAR